MEPMSIFSEFARAAGPAAVTALWQGAVLSLGLTICLRVAPGISAADRFRAWAAGFAALLALPLLPLLNGIHIGEGVVGSAAAAPVSRAWFEVDPRWALMIAGLWIAASVWRAADLAVHALKLRKVWKDTEPIEFDGAGVEVCATRALDRPSVIGFFRPRILIPAWLLERMTAAELEQVVLHEAEHLRRRDDWTNLLQKLALVVFPLNPALVWIERRLCHEREMACDDAVVRATGKPRAYAACLTSLAERGLERTREALSLGAWRRRPELVGRVHRLLKQAPAVSPVATRALLVVVSGGLVFGSVEFARAPQMVAFVAPVIAQSNTPDLVHRDARAMAGFHAVDAVAHVPGSVEQVNSAAGSHPAHATSRNSSTKSVHSAKSSDWKSAPEFFEVAAAEESAPASEKQQWIVLTAWERVVTVDRNSAMVADYQVYASAPDESAGQDGSASGAVKAPTPAEIRQWAIRQLILRTDPTRSDFNAAPKDNAPDTNSRPGQPAAMPLPSAEIPLHEGWLVFQL
jgi:BlaR1 peptidase M56